MTVLLKQDGDALLKQDGDSLLTQRPDIEARVSADGPLGVAGIVAAPVQAWLSVPGPLGSANVVAAQVLPLAAADSPLGRPSVLSIVHYGQVSSPGPLGSPTGEVWSDFTAGITGSTFYVCDLITPSGDIRVKMSSWQATLQAGRNNYVQCVIPAISDIVDDISAATAFRVSMSGSLEGEPFEYQIAYMDTPLIDFSESAQKHTAVLSGYSEGFLENESPETYTDRTLTGIRTIFTSPSGTRVRSDIDYIVRPSHRVYINETDSFIASYINYYVTASGEAYMDIGERG